MQKLTGFLLTLLFCLHTAFGQTHPKYVDFHIHTSLKNYYNAIKHPDAILAPNNPIKGLAQMNWKSKEIPRRKYKKFSGFDGAPQASFDILQSSGASILCTCITPLEEKTASSNKVPLLGFIGVPFKWINKTFVTKIDKERLDVIESNSSYGFNEFMGEYTFLKSQAASHPKYPRKVMLAKNSADLASITAANDIALVLTIEGAHALFGPSRATPAASESPVFDPATLQDILLNADSLKNLEHRVFFIAPSHLFWNGITGGAKGIDTDALGGLGRMILNLSAAWNIALFEQILTKHGDGFIDTAYNYRNKDGKYIAKDSCFCNATSTENNNNAGQRIVEQLLAPTGRHGKPIYIDMRHMDVQAREDYWALLKQKFPNDSIPMIISHAAVNGKNLAQARFYGSCPVADNYREIFQPRKFYKKQEERFQCAEKVGFTRINLDSTGWFHPWSLNLYNEEIERVYSTSGILGVTLEERALGRKRLNYKDDNHKKDQRRFLKQKGYSAAERKTFRVMEPFMRNTLYIVEHSGYAGLPKSWQHIALGSDFDGIINSIDVCPTAADIPHFYTLMVKNLPVFAEMLDKQYLLTDNITVLMDQMFYLNGERFIRKYF